MQVRLPNRRDRQEDEPKKTTGGRNRERRVSGKRRRTIREIETRWRGRGGKPGGGQKATDPKEETSEEETEGKRNREAEDKEAEKEDEAKEAERKASRK